MDFKLRVAVFTVQVSVRIPNLNQGMGKIVDYERPIFAITLPARYQVF